MPTRFEIAAVAALSVVVLGTAPAKATPSVEGVWTMGEGKAQIAIEACGPSLCGRIVNARKIEKNPDAVDKRNKNPLLRLRKLKGLMVLTGFIGGPDEWKGGTIYNPDDGGAYPATLKLVDSDTLKVTGCIVRPLCKTARLTRAPDRQGAQARAEEVAPVKRGS